MPLIADAVYPFTAIVGQEEMKTALLLTAVNPRIGGVLISGEKGTGKSTAARGLAALLPEIDVANGCAFSCDPHDPTSFCDSCREKAAENGLSWNRRRRRVVDLPLGATEDRVVGTIDIQQALSSGVKKFQPGVLALANRGILYVDEINLLEDHLVDLLLDSAAMGVNVVEREGMSLSHPARFVLVGTMNPEEGELRPQLLDRFGLCATVRGTTDPGERMEIVTRHAEWQADSEAFADEWAEEEKDLAESILRASGRVDAAGVDEGTLATVAGICIEMGVQGHRADITIIESARTLAALAGRERVTESDLGRVLPLCLGHRMRRLPFEEEPLDDDKLTSLLRGHRVPGLQPLRIGGNNGHRPKQAQETGTDGAGKQPAAACEGTPQEAPLGGVLRVADLASQIPAESQGNGRRQKSNVSGPRGRYVGSRTPNGDVKDVAVDATVRAAAVRACESEKVVPLQVAAQDLREKIRVRKAGATIVFCVDASGSMRARESMEAAKAAVLSLLVDAYKRRDRVGMVAFRGKRADVLLPPTSSAEQAHSRLTGLTTGGTTPLAHGLATSLNLLSRSAKRQADSVPWLVLVTDGNANVPIGNGLPEQEARSMAACFKQRKINSLVIDTGRMLRRETLAKQIAEAAGAQYLRLDELGAEGLAKAVRERVAQVPLILQ